MKSPNFANALTLAVALIIAYGTLTPPGTEESGLPFTDKQLHAMAFCLLVLPLGWQRPAWALWLGALALAGGGAIELVQPFVDRSGDWADFAADGLGVLIGLLPGQLRKRWKATNRTRA